MKLQTCLIPAAGQGIRARPQTRILPKSMLMVGDKPILQHTIEMARDQLGILSFVIITGHLGKLIRDYFNDGTHLGVTLRYVKNNSIDKGLAWSIYLGRDYINDNFLVLLGDEFYRGSNHHLINNQPLTDTLATCGVLRTEDSSLIKQNYAVVLSGNRIIRLLEKPKHISNPFLGTGTFVLSEKIFQLIQESYTHVNQPVEFINLLDSLCQRGYRVEKFLLSGNYVNINDMKALERANRLYID